MPGECVKSATAKSNPIHYRARGVGRLGPGRGSPPKTCRAVVIATNAIMKSGEIDMKKVTLAVATFAALTGSAIAAALRVDII